jgi:hypothetical protein
MESGIKEGRTVLSVNTHVRRSMFHRISCEAEADGTMAVGRIDILSCHLFGIRQRLASFAIALREKLGEGGPRN